MKAVMFFDCDSGLMGHEVTGLSVTQSAVVDTFYDENEAIQQNCNVASTNSFVLEVLGDRDSLQLTLLR